MFMKTTVVGEISKVGCNAVSGTPLGLIVVIFLATIEISNAP
jgi:hypothetical protein